MQRRNINFNSDRLNWLQAVKQKQLAETTSRSGIDRDRENKS